MKILIYTHSFYPMVGGLEAVNYLIAQSLSRYFDVTVVTPFLDVDREHTYSFRIIRTHSFKLLLKEYLKCDVYVHSVLRLKAVFPLLLFPKKWVAIHHQCSFEAWGGRKTALSQLKQLLSCFSHNVCVSDAVGKSLHLNHYVVIHNSYDSSLFVDYGNENRDGFVFLGRLVKEKGLDFLIKAYVKYLVRSNKKQNLYIVGDGPMRQKCQEMVEKAGLHSHVLFRGQMKGKELVDELNTHYCMIVPSLYKEAFGIVALEGLASGCQIVCSDGDGLSEAVGNCGLLFKKGNVEDLVNKMLIIDKRKPVDWQIVVDHLKKFTPEYMAQRYTSYFNAL